MRVRDDAAGTNFSFDQAGRRSSSLAEHRAGIAEVPGSSPGDGSIFGFSRAWRNSADAPRSDRGAARHGCSTHPARTKSLHACPGCGAARRVRSHDLSTRWARCTADPGPRCGARAARNRGPASARQREERRSARDTQLARLAQRQSIPLTPGRSGFRHPQRAPIIAPVAQRQSAGPTCRRPEDRSLAGVPITQASPNGEGPGR